MKAWLLRLSGLLLAGWLTYSVHDLHQGGYFELPDLPNGAYVASFKSGLRAIVLDVTPTDPSLENWPSWLRRLSAARSDRKFLGVPMDVEPFFEKTWSWCKAPTAKDVAAFRKMSDEFQKKFQNTKFEAVCRVKTDEKEIVRGFIFSVPKS